MEQLVLNEHLVADSYAEPEFRFPAWSAHAEMIRLIANIPEFHACRLGLISRRSFARTAEARLRHEISRDGRRFAFYPRIVPDDLAFVDGILRRLHSHGRIPAFDYDHDAYSEFILRLVQFDPGPHKTYVHPEESRLTFALAQILQPASILCVGSYFGFWAFAALAGALVGTSGRSHAILYDLDPGVCAVAGRMAELLGFADVAEIRCEDFLTLPENPDPHDLYLLDAETARDHPDPQLRDKAIYGAIMARLSGKSDGGSFMLAHNILFHNSLGLKSTNGRIAYNYDNMARFREQTLQLRWQEYIDSCEGMGFYAW
jgi:predicted O-methyltransferase YrrM